MAVNSSRSMNADMRIGATEKSYKRLAPDRGGEVEMMSAPGTIAAQSPLTGALEAPAPVMHDEALRAVYRSIPYRDSGNY